MFHIKKIYSKINFEDPKKIELCILVLCKNC